MAGRSRLRKKRYGKTNKAATFLHNTLVDAMRKREADQKAAERKRARAEKARESERRASLKARRKSDARSKAVKSSSRTEAKKAEKYLGWAKLLCMKHDIPEQCAEYIAQQAMEMHASKRDMETVIIAKQDWASFDWKAAKELERKKKEAFDALAEAVVDMAQKRQEEPAPKKPAKEGVEGFLLRWLGYLIAWFFALLGLGLMSESDTAWYWFSPFWLPALYLLGRYLLREDEEEGPAEQEASDGPSLVWRLFKWAFWLGLGWLVLYVGGYYIWAAIFS